jgi:retron-type reverse transcriptase
VIFEKICSFESLLLAFDLAKKGNRQKEYAIKFEFNLEQEIGRLVWELNSKRYRPSAYHHFIVSYPKMRAIAAPAFRDRVVQQSLVAKINPIFEKTFICDSYACRKDKGTHFGARRVKKFLQAAHTLYPQQPVYVLQTDIKSFFASMSWNVLKKLVAKKIQDQRTLKLINQFITIHLISTTSTQSNKEIKKVIDSEKQVGLPIGNLTSQLFANIYLNKLDHFVKEELRQRWYARYMDDFLIINPSKQKLHQIKKQITEFVNQQLQLKLHPNKTVIYPVKHGVPFVGYRIFHDHTLLRANSLLRMQQRLKKRKQQLKNGDITQEKYEQSVSSFKGHLKHADSYWLQKQMFE